MKKKSVSVIAVVLSLLLLSGCKDKKTQQIMPDDAPWNSGDGAAIMETDSGYYMNHDRMLFLRYHDKQTDKEIFLCNKPECMHDGNETCTATYKNLCCGMSTILYNGDLYFTGTEENKGKMEMGLYKVSADGSSLDRIDKFFDINSIPDEVIYNDNTIFIIHRGYAYIYYYLSTGDSYSGFVGSGFVRMNIKTGESEEINSSKDYFSSKEISKIHGCGDYVYFYLYDHLNKETGSYRYNVNKGEMSLLKDGQNENLDFDAVSEDKIYTIKKDPQTDKTSLLAYDSNTLKKLDDEIEISYPEDENERSLVSTEILSYEGKIFITGKETKVYENGKNIGTVWLSDILENADKDYCWVENFKISYDKLYCSKEYFEDNAIKCDVYCCSIDDIISGNAKWEKAYSRSEYEEKWMKQYAQANNQDNVN